MSLNDPCRDLVVSLCAQLAAIPGATGASISAAGTWVWILISALDEVAAQRLARNYGLGDLVERTADSGEKWLRATLNDEDEHLGTVTVEIVGPHRPPTPPQEPGP